MKISLTEATAILKQNGGVVAIPTETVWGLSASIKNEKAIEAIFQIKKRPPKNPLIIHLSEGQEIMKFLQTEASIPIALLDLIEKFWPGPLTVVVPIAVEKISPTIRANLGTAAFRVPAFPAVQELIKLVGPLVAPSANLSGRPSATRSIDVEADFGSSFPCFFPHDYIDEGTNFGIESTILIWNQNKSVWSIGRLGSLAISEIKEKIPTLPLCTTIEKRPSSLDPICPGQLFRHYAPNAKLYLSSNVPYSTQYEAIIGFSDKKYDMAEKVYYIGDLKDPSLSLHNLYKILRQLDYDQIQSAWIDLSFFTDQKRDHDLWTVLHDRLVKAASGS